jgi:hypothetical protein
LPVLDAVKNRKSLYSRRKEGKVMSNITNAATGAIAKTGEIVAESMKAQAAATAVQTIISLAKTRLGEYWPEALDTPMGEAALELAAPIIAMTMFEAFGSQIPGAQHGRMVAEYAMKGVSANKMQELAEAVKPLMIDLIALGAGLMQQQLPEGK